MEFFNIFANWMFNNGFWPFVGGLIVIMVMASVIQFVVEKLLYLIQVLIRGYPPVEKITHIHKNENGEKVTEEQVKAE